MMSITTIEQQLKTLVKEYLEAEDAENFELSDEISDNKVKNLAAELFREETGFSKEREIQTIFSIAIGKSISDQEKDRYIDFRIQQLKNLCRNIKRFQEIAERFVTSIGGDPQTIEYTKADTHHGGKVPFSCVIGGRKVFIKPRNADLDIAIIALFEKLNQVQPDLMLPTYNIENIENKEIKSTWSIWDAIEGYEPGEGIEIIETGFLESASFKFNLSELEMQDLKTKLYRIDAVASKIHLSDLHGENIIFTNLIKDEESSELGMTVLKKARIEAPIDIFPIDLESIQRESLTGLLHAASSNQITLNEPARQAIEEFNRRAEDIPFRFVPLPTSRFLGHLDNPNNIPSVCDLVRQTLQEKKLTFSDEKGDLSSFIKNCFENSEVPFFTCRNNIVYPGF